MTPHQTVEHGIWRCHDCGQSLRTKHITEDLLPVNCNCANGSFDFERVTCVTLERRPDRWQRFVDDLPADWPFKEPEKIYGIDGKKVHPPGWWKQGGGAWGCYRAHLRIIEDCLNNDIQSVLLLEDDALCCENFVQRWEAFKTELPANWQMVYLGGQHLRTDKHPPIRISEQVYQPFNVNRTHAFALRGLAFMRKVYKHLTTVDWNRGDHIDHHLGRLHQRRQDRIYCPKEWLIGQAEGDSNINGRGMPERFWQPAEQIAESVSDFVAVLGTHSSGSSCFAGALHYLGLHLGNTFVNGPWQSGSFEAQGLADICEGALPFMSVTPPTTNMQGRLNNWVTQRCREAKVRNTLAGGKYPQLAAIIDQLNRPYKVLWIDRPLDEAIASLVRRCNGRHSETEIAEHQTFLYDKITKVVSRVPEFLRITYEELLSDPEQTLLKVGDFLQLEFSKVQLADAIRHIDPSQRHVNISKKFPKVLDAS